MFYPGTEFLLMRIMLLLLLAGIGGLVTIPLAIIKQWGHKSIRLKSWLLLFVGTALGFYIGCLVQRPIDNWDENQRNISGRLISTNLNDYYIKNGRFPETLSQLDAATLNNSLPTNYKVDRYTYSVDSNKYHLDIPIPLTSRWHWNKDIQTFEYQN